MKQDRRMGTEAAPFCLLAPLEDPGADFDMTVKEIVRILYLSGAAAGDISILDLDVINHMWRMLLPARGRVGPATFAVIADCADTAGEALGTPVEWADRQDLGGDIAEAFEDAGEWALNFLTKISAYSALSALTGPLAAIGLGLLHFAGLEDPLADLTTSPFDFRIPETENHRLMIESSRYLTNAAIIADLRRRGGHDNLDEILAQQNEVREWLLKELQRITINDFDEYNSRPYTRLSLEAIQNLHDFADDGTAVGNAMRTAARIVLDLSAAKFAVGSNRGRRIAPYRRLAEHDGSNIPLAGRHLYHVVSGADHEVNRAHVLAGQTQLLETVEKGPTAADPDAAEIRTGASVPTDVADDMVNTASSSYRLPLPILEVMTERILPYEQVVKHAGIEVYYNHPAFTMSLGGVRRDAALSVIFGAKDNDNDDGVAMPTNLIATMRGLHAQETFQFQGSEKGYDRLANLCGWKGFICGIKPVFGNICMLEELQADGTAHLFANSALPNLAPAGESGCRPDRTQDAAGRPVDARRPGPHFFLAAKTGRCKDVQFCPEPQLYGIMEMVPATLEEAYSDAHYAAFRAERKGALAAWRPSPDGDGTYRNRDGDTIEFRVAETDDEDDRHSRLWKVNGVLPYTGPTGGAVIQRGNTRGKVTITSPWSQAAIDIDFTDWSNPSITDIPAPEGGRSELYAAGNDGRVTWRKHWRALGPQPTELQLTGPRRAAKGFERFATVIAAIGSPVVYAMEPNGDLFWLRHDGYRDGSDQWRVSPRIGNGWTSFTHIFAGENGVIYGLKPNGELWWHRHLGHEDGTDSWDTAVVVGRGWSIFQNLFAGSGGLIYGVKADGTLWWHRHLGHQTGLFAWEEPVSREVGSGWQGVRVLSVGRGVLYVVKPNGELNWFRHHGHETGVFNWAGGVTLERGWTGLKHVFALSPNE
jgi:hypothetical protein